MVAGAYDVIVVGAGVFGAWTAFRLCEQGARVMILDAFGPGNSRASSGGESRVMRLGYGPDAIYTSSAKRSLHLWDDFCKQTGQMLFHRTGVLWLAQDKDPYSLATKQTLKECEVEFEELTRAQLESRYPQIRFEEIAWGIYEPNSGVLMAREAVQAVVAEGQKKGVTYRTASVLSPRGKGRLESIATNAGEVISGAEFVFACGPWLPKLFPALLSELIQVTRQELFFLGVPAGDDSFSLPNLPVWIDFNDLVYGLPNVDGRGYKIAIDAHGPDFDPDTGERMASREGLSAVRQYLAKRIPRLADAPMVESRVCQYENTSNGDFLIDRHPDFNNLWLLGGGSGHGFKHGPAVGEYIAGLIHGQATPETRFSLATKSRVHQREVY